MRRGQPGCLPAREKRASSSRSRRAAPTSAVPVRWVTAAERFVCPCHGGVYDFEGKVAGGPPVRPLDRFVTRVQGGQVQIGPRYSVNSQLERFSPRDPGEPLDGLWQYLYPKRVRPPTSLTMARRCQSSRPKLPLPGKPARPPGRSRTAGQRRRLAEGTGQGADRSRPEPGSSAGSTSAPARAASCAASCSARSRRGRTGSTRSARRRCSRSSRRRSPACSWRCTTTRRRRGAYDSVQHITNDVFLGELVRGMHRWGATVMVVLIFLHMGRTFFFGAYKYPRELNWVIGVVLLVLTMAMALTGYLLPFDQRSFWATVVAVNITGTGPVVGPYLADFLRAGSEFGGDHAVALLRDPHAADPGPDRRPDRRPPLSGHEARHDRAALAEGGADGAAREGAGVSGRTMNRRGQRAVPARVPDPEEPGEAVLPLRGAEGLGDGVHHARRDHRDGGRPRRRRAGEQGRPDHHHLHAASRVVLLLPVRAAARDQAARARDPGDGRHPDAADGRCSRCCRSTTATPSGGRSAGRSRPRSGIATIAIMAYLTYLGAHAEAPDKIDMHVPASRRGRARRSPTSRAAAPATSSARPATPGPGPELTKIGAAPRAGRRSRGRCATRPAPMPSYSDLPPEKFDALVDYLAALR